MSLIRIQKRVIQVLAHYLGQVAAPTSTATVTITEVVLCPDLTLAKVYLSLLDLKGEHEPASLLGKWLAPHRFAMQQVLAQQLRHQVRKVPTTLCFYLDQRSLAAAQLDLLLLPT